MYVDIIIESIYNERGGVKDWRLFVGSHRLAEDIDPVA